MKENVVTLATVVKATINASAVYTLHGCSQYLCVRSVLY